MCNLCGMTNVTPAWYFSSLDGAGLRLDRKSRPELSLGSVDFVVNKDYCVRDQQEPIFVFALDVSARAVASGVTVACLRAIQNTLALLPGGESTKAGIITFSDQIHYYLVREEKGDAPEAVKIFVSDVDDPLAALPISKWLFSTKTQMSSLQLLLHRIPQMLPALQRRNFSGSSSQQQYASSEMLSGPTAAIKSIQEALHKDGGRLYVLTPCHPTVGFGKVRIRETLSAYGAEAEHLLYASTAVAAELVKSADDKAVLVKYLHLAEDCAKSNVSVEILLCADSDEYRDTALLGDICDRTGGALHMITGSMTIEENVQRLEQQLAHTVMQVRGSEAVMKVRTSLGYKVEKAIGRGFYNDTLAELDIAGLDSDETFCYLLQHDGILKDEGNFYVQVAILYTNCNKQRLVRVHNLCMIASSNPTIIFRHADLDACVTVVAKMAADKALNAPLAVDNNSARGWLNFIITEILYKYRTNCSAQSPRGQLILPESLKLLPLYVLGMRKHPALMENNPAAASNGGGGGGAGGGATRTLGGAVKVSVRADERAFELRRLRAMPVRNTINTLYPRLYSLHTLQDSDELDDPIDTSVDIGCQLPRSLSATSEVFDSEGVYLMDDGCTLWLYICRSAPHEWLEEWFAVPAHSRPSHVSFRLASDTACKISSLVEALRAINPHKAELKVIWADEPPSFNSNRFSIRLVEDSIFGAMSYVDYLCRLHSKITSKNDK